MTTADVPIAIAEIQLPVEGMTCASCVNRIERFLKKTPGVEEATVNLATEVATIRYLPDQAGTAELVSAIEAAGYDVRSEPAVSTAGSLIDAADGETADRARDAAALLLRAVVSIGVAAGIMVVMFWPQAVVSAETLNNGYEAYMLYCYACHGPNGDGTGKALVAVDKPRERTVDLAEGARGLHRPLRACNLSFLTYRPYDNPTLPAPSPACASDIHFRTSQ